MYVDEKKKAKNTHNNKQINKNINFKSSFVNTKYCYLLSGKFIIKQKQVFVHGAYSY